MMELNDLTTNVLRILYKAMFRMLVLYTSHTHLLSTPRE